MKWKVRAWSVNMCNGGEVRVRGQGIICEEKKKCMPWSGEDF